MSRRSKSHPAPQNPINPKDRDALVSFTTSPRRLLSNSNRLSLLPARTECKVEGAIVTFIKYPFPRQTLLLDRAGHLTLFNHVKLSARELLTSNGAIASTVHATRLLFAEALRSQKSQKVSKSHVHSVRQMFRLETPL